METPHGRIEKSNHGRPNRFSEDYDESMEETIRPNRNNKSNRASQVFEEMRQHAKTPELHAIPTPPRSNAVPISQNFSHAGLVHEFLNLDDVNAEYVKMETGFDAMNFPHNQMPTISPSMS